jgi:hypothetical protein
VKPTLLLMPRQNHPAKTTASMHPALLRSLLIRPASLTSMYQIWK